MGTQATETTAIDHAAVEAFAMRVAGDVAGGFTSALASVGDRLGLFSALADGPATSAELAARAGLDERYTREWLFAMVSASYVTADAGEERFTLPPEHVPVLAQESGLAFAGGAQQLLRGLTGALDEVETAFRTGAGVPQRAYDDHFWIGLERQTGINYENRLVQEWVPAVEGLDARLRAGATVADVGCGTGRAAIRLAQAYPAIRVEGFDVHGPALERAREEAAAAGVADRVTFTRLDAARGLPGRYDAVTVFDVLHDSHDPEGLARAVRRALAPDGVALITEMQCGERLADNVGPVGTILYGSSVLYCMSVSLATGGAGLGTCGLPESRLRELAVRAGFRSLVPRVEGPFDLLYEARG